jgi:hypothetical protein
VLAIVRAGPFETRMTTAIDNTRTVNEHLTSALPVLRRGADAADGSVVGWLVPTMVRPRTAVDLDVPLTALGGLSADVLDARTPWLAEGQRVFFDRDAPAPDALDRLEAGLPIAVGQLELEPLAADPAAGYWVYEVTRR